MLGAHTGSANKEHALIYLIVRERGYARQPATFFDAPLDLWCKRCSTAWSVQELWLAGPSAAPANASSIHNTQ